MKKIEILLGVIFGLLVVLIILDISILRNLQKIGTFYVGSVETASLKPLPKLVKYYEPEYPESAQKAGLEGKVIVKVEVDERGRVSKALIIRSSGYEILDSAALEAVKKFKFEPAVENGRPIKSSLMIPFAFSFKK